ncbi:phosphoglycolate phosphatase [Azospirillum sp. BE72]|uniref:phosphoglycolate phosphatase n=1 Tax=Azospirillum sp. BE72 TaxID=2817776 RepID=UPI002866840E|nr:phosphoglycolate phosphatase [Azospirillum sp. BE72]MDR6772338.1 phosphoglycolate phosphatase [Azospirillum sp. BE72]
MTNPADSLDRPAIRAVAFDLDGTLVDSVADLMHASNALLAELGRPPVDLPSVRSFVGDGAPKLVERVLAATGGAPAPDEAARCLERFLAIYEADPSAHSALYPGVADTLKALAAAGLRLGVCTNKPMAATMRLLDDLGIAGRFAAVVGGDSYPTRKPSPEPLLGLLERLGVRPEEAVFVGDNEHDVAAARAAGVARVLMVPYGYARVPLAGLPHDGVLDGFADLVKRLSC